jgi:hypothetical protein
LDFFAKHWGDLASVVGFAVSVVGFWYAISLARQARTAAEQARDAAEAARSRIFSVDTIKELTTAKMALSEIIRLQRLNAQNVPWDIVLERYEVPATASFVAPRGWVFRTRRDSRLEKPLHF